MKTIKRRNWLITALCFALWIQPGLAEEIDTHGLTLEEYNALTENERRLIVLFDKSIYAEDTPEANRLLDEWVHEDYIQHSPGIGQGREGLREFLKKTLWPLPGKGQHIRFTVANIFSDASGKKVAFHRTARIFNDAGEIIMVRPVAEFVIFDDQNRLYEHWDVVAPPVADLGWDANDLSTAGNINVELPD